MSNSDQVTPVFLPAGVAAPEQPVGYVVDLTGGIEALDLLTGKLLWQAALNARPIFVFENLLVALRPMQDRANLLQFIVVDRNAKGELVLESKPVVFPDWVRANIEQDQSFSYRISAEQNDLIFHWAARARYQGGASPSAKILKQFTQDAAGIVRFNFRTGEVKELPAPEEMKIELPEALQEASLFSYQQGGSSIWHTEPWAFDGRFAVIIGEVLDDLQALKLQKWDAETAEIEPPIPLVTGQALVSYVTPDGLFLFIHSEIQSQDHNHDWWLFSVATGKGLAVLNYEDGTREACVVNSVIYFLVDDPPPTLRSGGETVQSTLKAVDVASGKLLWERLLSRRPTKKQTAQRQ